MIIMTFRMGPPKRAYRGLVLTTDEVERPICSRIFLCETSIEHSEEAKLGVVPAQEIDQELGDFKAWLLSSESPHFKEEDSLKTELFSMLTV